MFHTTYQCIIEKAVLIIFYIMLWYRIFSIELIHRSLPFCSNFILTIKILGKKGNQILTSGKRPGPEIWIQCGFLALAVNGKNFQQILNEKVADYKNMCILRPPGPRGTL